MRSAAGNSSSQSGRGSEASRLSNYGEIISEDAFVDFTNMSAARAVSNAVADDYRDNLSDTTAPFGTLIPGSTRTGTIEIGGDRDIFTIQLTAGQTYTFNLNRGSGTGLADPVLGLFNASGAQLASNDDFGSGRNSQITYTATSSGTHYLSAQGYQSGTGSYTLSSTGAPPVATDDYRDSVTDTTAPFGSLAVGTTRTGRIEASGDADLFALTVTAGQTYTINLNAAASGGISDPVLRLLNSSGGQIAINDDFGGGRNSQITYTASASGTIYVEAKGYQTATGNYTVSATGSTPPAPTDDFRDSVTDTTAPFGGVTVGATASTGRIETGGDADIFSVSLTAGQTYSFTLNSAATGGIGDPTLRLINSSGTQLAANNDAGGTSNSQITYTATSSGTFYLEAKGAVATATGNYTLGATNTTAPAPGGFDIVIRYTGDAQYQSLFEQAAARCGKSVIIGDLPNFTSRTNGVIDDLLIDASFAPIDGRGGTLAQAGAREIRSTADGGLPASGIMQFDTADYSGPTDQLFGVILHEMGHILGFSGQIFQRFGLSDGGTRYTGANALAEYRLLTGNANETFIPLENDGGPGTAFSHWEESIFQSELMTGFASGGLEMSRMTIAALKDLGYQVNLNEADPYTLPSRIEGLNSLVAPDAIFGVI